jgi:hypothetical protein
MPDKTVLLYDASNQPLRVKGIRVELFDASSGLLVDAQNSANLDPNAGPLSVEWGVVLSFTAGTSPLDLLLTDPLYRYPGNTVRYLNGDLQDRVYIDVLQLPQSVGGQTGPPVSAGALDLVSWVQAGLHWSEPDKDAVLNLLFNYLRVIVARPARTERSQRLKEVALNWEAALDRLGIPSQLFKRGRRSSGGSAPREIIWQRPEPESGAQSGSAM